MKAVKIILWWLCISVIIIAEQACTQKTTSSQQASGNPTNSFDPGTDPDTDTPPLSGFHWKTLSIGAGGWCTGMDSERCFPHFRWWSNMDLCSQRLEVHAFGFGKAATASSYPAIFIAGWVNGVYGIYRSDDDCATWESLGVNPADNIDNIVSIDGDKDLFGSIYMAFGSSGFAYGQFY